MDAKLAWLAGVGTASGLFLEQDFNVPHVPATLSGIQSTNDTLEMGTSSQVDILNIAMEAISAPALSPIELDTYIVNIMALPLKRNNLYAYPRENTNGSLTSVNTREYGEAVGAIRGFQPPNGPCRICGKSHRDLRHVAIGMNLVAPGLKLASLKTHFKDRPSIWQLDGVLMMEPHWNGPVLQDFYLDRGVDYVCPRCPRADHNTPKKMSYRDVMNILANTTFSQELSPPMTGDELFWHMFITHPGDFCFYMLNDVLPVKFTQPFFIKYSNFSDSFHYNNRLRTYDFITKSRYSVITDFKPQPTDGTLVDVFSDGWIETATIMDTSWRASVGLSAPEYSEFTPKLSLIKLRKSWDDTASVDNVSQAWKKRLRDAGVGIEPPKKRRSTARSVTPRAFHKEYSRMGLPRLYAEEALVSFVDRQYGEVLTEGTEYDFVYGGSDNLTTAAQANVFLNQVQTKLFLMSYPGSIFGECKQADIFRTMNGAAHVVYLMKRMPGLKPAISADLGARRFDTVLKVLPMVLRALTHTVLLLKDLNKAPLWLPSNLYLHNTGAVIKLPHMLQFTTPIDFQNYMAVTNMVLTGSADRAQYTNQERDLMGNSPQVVVELQNLQAAIRSGTLMQRGDTMANPDNRVFKVMADTGEIPVATVLPSTLVETPVTSNVVIDQLLITMGNLLFRQFEDLL